MIRRYIRQFNAISFPEEQDEFLQSDFQESVVDKSAFRPDVSNLALSAAIGSGRQPVYDYVGTSPHDIGINLGWLRSKARDVTEIDAAIAASEQILENAKAEDKANVEAIKERQKALDDVKQVISEATKSTKEVSEFSTD